MHSFSVTIYGFVVYLYHFFSLFFLSKIQDTDDEKGFAVQSWRSECLPVFIVLCCWVAAVTVTKFMLKTVESDSGESYMSIFLGGCIHYNLVETCL